MANEFKVKNGLIVTKVVPDVAADAASAFVFYKKNGTDPVLSINTSTGVLTGIASTGAVENSLDLVSSGAMFTALAGKQATLVSGTNIKTVNSTSLLGSGDLAVGTVTSVSSANTDIDVANGTSTPTLTLNAATSGANKILKVGADGKIDTAVLPALAITDTYVVASEVAQLALTVQKGDVAVRTDQNKTYINSTGNNTAMSDWTEIVAPGTGVTSVAAGNGMSFTTITASGTVTMGTPSSIDSGTSNSATAGTHTHAISNNGVTFAKMQTVDNGRILGRSSSGTGNIESLAPSTARTVLELNNVTNHAQIQKLASSTDGNVPIWNGTDGNLLANGYGVQSVLANSSTHLVRADAIVTALAGKSDTNHTHSAATTSVAGFMSASDKTKLDGIATGATANTGTVTSITPGAGFTSTTPITASGTLNVGVPMDITSSSTSEFGTGGDLGKHSHALANNAVTLGKIATIANNRILGNVSGSAASPAELTAAQVITMLGIPATTIVSTSINNTTTDIEALDITSITEGAIHYEYFIFKSGATRAGTLKVVWSGTSVEMYETSTSDIGDTSDFTWAASIASSTLSVEGTTTGNYTKVKLVRTPMY